MAIHFTKIGIKNFRQFKNVLFDFTDPETGQPLEKVCLVGGNGTGKTTILGLLQGLLSFDDDDNFSFEGEPVVEMTRGNERGVFVSEKALGPPQIFQMRASDDFKTDWISKLVPDCYRDKSLAPASQALQNDLCRSFRLFVPPDSELSTTSWEKNGGIPGPSLGDALKKLDWVERSQTIGQEHISTFWTHLVASIKIRERKFLRFQKLPENREKTIQVVEDEFELSNPEILKSLEKFWAPFLERAGLEFDWENASEPVQLTDHFEGYVRLKSTHKKVPYHLLSTGIRNFIFKLGHIHTLAQRFEDESGFLLVDEPENSLHPDFLYDLVDFYQQAAPNAQLFMATHNPIIAAQFRPEERFILSFDDDFNVQVSRGISPEGDDPNDVLRKDFEVRNIYGKKGIEAWERFKKLERSIKAGEVTDSETLAEFMSLGSTYNFPVSP